MNVQVKPSVFVSKFELFNIGHLLHMKHKYYIDAAAQYSTKGLTDTQGLNTYKIATSKLVIRMY